jgi:hypothetical protein
MGFFDNLDDPQKLALITAGLGLMSSSPVKMSTTGQFANAGLLGLNAYSGARAQQRQDQKDELGTLATTYKILEDQDNQARTTALFTGQPYSPDPLLGRYRERMATLLNGPSRVANQTPITSGLLGNATPAAPANSPSTGSPATSGGLLGNAAAPAPSGLLSPDRPSLAQVPAPANPAQVSQPLPMPSQVPQPQPLASNAGQKRLPTIPELLAGAGIDPRVAAVVGRTPEGQRTILTRLSETYGPRVVNNVLMQYQANGQTRFLGGVVSQDSLPVTSDASGKLQGQPIPGSTDYFANRAGAITQAQEGARARNDLVAIPQGDGTVRYVTRAQAVNMTGQQNGPQIPTQASPTNPMGYGVATQVTPDVQHARDVERLRILLQERSDQLRQYGQVDPALQTEIEAAQGSASDSRNAKAPPWEQANSLNYNAPQPAPVTPTRPSQQVGFPAGQSTAAKVAAETQPKLQLEQLTQSYADNSKANDSLVFIDAAKRAVNGATTTGLFAKPALLAARIGTAFGVTDPKYASDPQVFMAMAGRSVMGVIKNLGSGSGISDADREYAAKAMGGDIRLDNDSINRLLDIQQRAILRGVELHNNRVEQAAQAGVPSVFDYRITPYQPAANDPLTVSVGGQVIKFPNAQAAQAFKKRAGMQ